MSGSKAAASPCGWRRVGGRGGAARGRRRFVVVRATVLVRRRVVGGGGGDARGLRLVTVVVAFCGRRGAARDAVAS